jgi:hypothetical protein
MSEDIHQIDAFSILDPDTDGECWVGVRSFRGRLLLALSRRDDGDVEVSFGHADAERLANALDRWRASRTSAGSKEAHP